MNYFHGEILKVKLIYQNGFNDYFYLSFPPSPNYVNTEKAFSHCAVKVFNSLPYDIRSAESVSSFKTKLKTYFFSLAFD